MTELPNPVPFLQDLIRIQSLTDEEAEIGARVLEEMLAVGFDAAWTDEKGNAFGLYRGLEPGPAWMLLTHLDHIDVGDEALWAHPPFAGVLEDGAVHGRGAVDIKGPLAAHVYTVANLAAQGIRPTRSVVVASPVAEETSGLGAAFMVDHLPLQVPGGERLEIGACIVGEPSSNRVMLGHRGITRVTVSFRGRAHHASLGLHDENPYFDLAVFLERLKRYTLPSHPVLGPSNLSPTMIQADTQSPNLTPNRIELMLDWRTTSETANDVRQILEELTQGLNTSFVNYDEWQRGPGGSSNPGFYTEPTHRIVQDLQRAVLEANPDAPEPGVWRFATDGRFTHAAGIPTVGFGPGDENLAHTTKERIEVSALEFYIAVLARFLLEHAPT